jgi:hypothetical protein
MYKKDIKYFINNELARGEVELTLELLNNYSVLA